MISTLLAGAPTKPKLPARRSALLPAAAMISDPRCRARCPAAEYGGWACGTGAPSDMEMTGQRLATAQLIPARIPASVPLPELLSTFPAKMSASWATP
jgi:hypothetical protein